MDECRQCGLYQPSAPPSPASKLTPASLPIATGTDPAASDDLRSVAPRVSLWLPLFLEPGARRNGFDHLVKTSCPCLATMCANP
jgi:hypothetical protein